MSLPDTMKTSGDLVQEILGHEWVAIQIGKNMPHPVVMRVNNTDEGYDEWMQEVQCYGVISRKPEHRYIKFTEQGQEPIPMRTHFVFWYRGVCVILESVEIFDISIKGSAIPEILGRLKEQKQQSR